MVEVCRAGYSVPGFSFVEGVGFRSRDCSVLIVDTGVADTLRVSCGDNAEEGCFLVSLLRDCQSEKRLLSGGHKTYATSAFRASFESVMKLISSLGSG